MLTHGGSVEAERNGSGGLAGAQSPPRNRHA
jgi:hypothetical protein